jgi:hypothetical protein
MRQRITTPEARAIRAELERLERTRAANDWQRVPRFDRLAILRRLRELRERLASIGDTL